MEKSEPRIIAGDLSNEELLKWMQEKVWASQQLKEALSLKEHYEEALKENNDRIEALTNRAALELVVEPLVNAATAKSPDPMKVAIRAFSYVIKCLLEDAERLQELEPTRSTANNIRSGNYATRDQQAFLKTWATATLLSMRESPELFEG
ncbi:hypothetical protein [Rouxiella silvae]|nr:hypothetical protein [Rouxiella silvae]